MRMPRSLQVRLGLSIGILLTLLWIGAAAVTAVIVRHEIDQVFDSALQETAQRLLPLAVVEIIDREEAGISQRLAAVREHDEFLTYIVRDADGRILLQSHAADPEVFPAYTEPGFAQTPSHRFYNEEALQGTVRITVAEPMEHRRAIARETQLALGLPLVIVFPIALGVIVVAVRASVVPLRRFRERLQARSARDLSAVPADGLPSELAPVAATLNSLLDRLKAAFDAERSFAANAAHELRTPLAGAIAQAQRLQAETDDASARQRANDIEASLKRLTRMLERLLQLARAEGGPLRLERSADLRGVARVVIDDLERTTRPGRISSRLPDRPVLSDIDPDVFGIICRNLVENAARHGSRAAPVEVVLEEDGTLRVANDGPVVPAEMLARLTDRFSRGESQHAGSGLGLAIVSAIAERIGSRLVLQSPRRGESSGFEASLRLPVTSELP